MFVQFGVFEHNRVPQSLDSTLTEVPAWIHCNFSIIRKERECHNPLRENEKFKDGDRYGKKKKKCKKVDKQITERKKRGTKKCELLLLCGLLKSLRGDLRVSEDKVGRGVRSLRARRGTAHAWPSLCIPTDLIYTLFLLYLCLYSSCLSKPVIMSCRTWLTLGDMLICTFNFLCVNGNFCLLFFISLSLCSTLEQKRFLHYMFAGVWKYRHPHVEGLVNHTVVRGKYALFCWGLAIHHKAMTNKSNKLFIVSGVRMVTTLHTDWNGIYTKNWP